MSTALREAVQKLAVARSAEAAVKVVLQEKRDQFAAANAALLATEKEAKTAVAQAEADVQALSLAAYNADKSNKKPAEGVEIKLFTVYTYDPAKAFAWAKEKGMCLIPEKLDEAAFQKVAAATPDSVPFVTITKEPKPTIAKDLSAYVPVEDAPAAVTQLPVAYEAAPAAVGEPAPRRRGPRMTRRTVTPIESLPETAEAPASGERLPWED